MTRRFYSHCKFALFLFLLFSGLVLSHPVQAHSEQEVPSQVDIWPQESFLTVVISGSNGDLHEVLHSGSHGHEAASPLSFSAEEREKVNKYFQQHLMLKQGDERLAGELQVLRTTDPDPLNASLQRYEAIYRFERDPRLANSPLRVTSALFGFLSKSSTIISVRGVTKSIGEGQTVQFKPELTISSTGQNATDWAIQGALHLFESYDLLALVVAVLLAAAYMPWTSLAAALGAFAVAQGVVFAATIARDTPLSSHVIGVGTALAAAGTGAYAWWRARSESGNNHGAIIGLLCLSRAAGIIHGFSLSPQLRERGLPESGLFFCVLAFVLGITLAQLGFCALALPLMMKLRTKFDLESQYGGLSYPRALQWASGFVVVLGGYWMLQRLVY